MDIQRIFQLTYSTLHVDFWTTDFRTTHYNNFESTRSAKIDENNKLKPGKTLSNNRRAAGFGSSQLVGA